MFLHATRARYVRDYLIEIALNDGTEGVADLAPEFLCFQAFKGSPELAGQFRVWGYLK